MQCSLPDIDLAVSKRLLPIVQRDEPDPGLGSVHADLRHQAQHLLEQLYRRHHSSYQLAYGDGAAVPTGSATRCPIGADAILAAGAIGQFFIVHVIGAVAAPAKANMARVALQPAKDRQRP